MNFFQIASLLITLSALFSYLNFQYIRMPTKIGVMGIALALSIALLASGLLGVPGARQRAAHILNGIDFNQVLLHGLLAFLLFAGAQSINLNDLRSEKTRRSYAAEFRSHSRSRCRQVPTATSSSR
jgi:Na+:H+ antiporter